MKTRSKKPSPRAAPVMAGAEAPVAAHAEDSAMSFARAELYGHRLSSQPTPGHPLPGPVQRKMERSLGQDLSRVRVHEGTHVEHLGAAAYTRGERIHFAPGQYRPHSPEGQRMLGHELAHVIQQRQGRVARGASNALNEDSKLEAEADQLGARAAAGHAAPGHGSDHGSGHGSGHGGHGAR
jgi:hypothetical protein